MRTDIRQLTVEATLVMAAAAAAAMDHTKEEEMEVPTEAVATTALLRLLLLLSLLPQLVETATDSLPLLLQAALAETAMVPVLRFLPPLSRLSPRAWRPHLRQPALLHLAMAQATELATATKRLPTSFTMSNGLFSAGSCFSLEIYG